MPLAKPIGLPPASDRCWNIQTNDGGGHKRKDRPNGGMYITRALTSTTLSTMGPTETFIISKKRRRK